MELEVHTIFFKEFDKKKPWKNKIKNRNKSRNSLKKWRDLWMKNTNKRVHRNLIKIFLYSQRYLLIRIVGMYVTHSKDKIKLIEEREKSVEITPKRLQNSKNEQSCITAEESHCAGRKLLFCTFIFSCIVCVALLKSFSSWWCPFLSSRLP